ncbi:MAG: CheR family methyltransferase [bacterium]
MMPEAPRRRQATLEDSPDNSILIKIRDFIYQQSGLYFSEKNLDSLQKKLICRLESLNLNSINEYYHYLLDDSSRTSELKPLFDSLINSQTSFFRYASQLKALQEQILPALMRSKIQNEEQVLKILSCGCSTGEEPYTLAILMLETLGQIIDRWKVEITGIDISHAALDAAGQGIYNHYSLRNTPETIMNRYFDPLGPDSYRLRDRVREMVHFAYLNLNDEVHMRTLSPVDVIFCRNVLIYFSEDSKRAVINQFYNIINPGGYLFVGPSESLFGLSRSFKLLLFPGALVYKKERDPP